MAIIKVVVTLVAAVIVVSVSAAFALASTPSRGTTPATAVRIQRETTMTCAACHSGNPAPTSGADVPADVCFDCHGAKGPAPVVYGGSKDNYLKGAPHKGHLASHGGTGYHGCTSCHDVHGKDIIPGSKLLKSDPAKGVVSQNPTATDGEAGYGAFTQPVTNERDFCLDCHGGPFRYTSRGRVPQTLADFQTVYSDCAPCHSDGKYFTIDDPDQRGTASHVMTAKIQVGKHQIAWKPSARNTDGPTADTNSCTVCHDGEDFPHKSGGDYLIAGYSSPDDGFCARCHTDTGDYATAKAGVGKTY